MTAIANTTTTLVSVGNREDLEDVIYRVAPEETPFINNIGAARAKAVYHEWQTENLATPNPANAQLEGDDITSFDAPNLTTRVGNRLQIFRKTAVVSQTEDAVDKAGRTSELDRQVILKGKEMKRDMEARFIGNYPSQVEAGATPRASAGALAWCVTNTSLGTGGTNGGFSGGTVAAATNGTLRAFTEAQVKAAMAAAFTAGGHPNQIYMGPIQKQEFSAFPGIAQQRHEVGNSDGGGKIIGAVDVYVSDFGSLNAIPHPYGLSRDALGIDPDMWAIGTLRGMETETLAKTGDANKRLLIAEKTLVCRNERSSFAIRDLS